MRRILLGVALLIAGTVVLLLTPATVAVNAGRSDARHTPTTSVVQHTTTTVVGPIPGQRLSSARGDPPGFIRQHGTVLTLDGRVFTFAGVNAYELATWYGVDAGCGATFSQAQLDSFFVSLPPNSVVRTWAWQGAVGTVPSTHVRTWAPLDRLVATAAAHGDRLILDLGTQGGDCDDGHWKDLAWYKGGYRTIFNDDHRGLDIVSYRDWVAEVVARYAGSQAVAMWEPLNEPEASNCPAGFRGPACSGHQTCRDEPTSAIALRSFFDDIGGLIHSLDPGRPVSSGLIASGQCGTEGGDAAFVQASDGISVTSVHDYYGGSTSLPGAGTNGERARLAEANRLNKPLMVGEIGILAGFGGGRCASPQLRASEFAAKITGDLAAGVVGAFVWSWVPPPRQAGCSFDVPPDDPYMAWLLHPGPVRTGHFTS